MAKRKPAAVMGSLVNLKNVATHKCIALTIHIPAEAAQEVLAAFGWPTMVDPVPVAVARLEASASLSHPVIDEVRLEVGGCQEQPSAEVQRPDLAGVPPGPQTEPTRLRHWAEMSPAQQTGVIRNERDFWDFFGVGSADAARNYIREWCGVKTCADILPGTEAAARWAQLQVRYGNWLRQRRGAA
jgi:hypothetical protein